MIFTKRSNTLSWGRVHRTPQRAAAPRYREDLPRIIASRPVASVLPVGLRRSYGDSVLNSEGGLVEVTGLDRFISFDKATGVLRAEAGVSLNDIMQLVVPLGYFVPVTPGTRFVTLGGAIANDVHGKNHHRSGCFGCHVHRLSLVRSDGTDEIGPKRNKDLFRATVGGLGLTGIIEWAEIELCPIPSSTLDVEIIPFGSLNEFWQIAAASTATHEHTVAWVDCTATGTRSGRGVFSRGNWSSDGALEPHDETQRLGMPVEAPSHLLNQVTVDLFNRAYHAAQTHKSGRHRQHYSSFFHPLDGIANWNRLYGRRGLRQYQCVVPPSTMKDAIAKLLKEIARSGQGSFLAVLKTFGEISSPGMLSFPMEGATLALDFPNRGEKTLELLSRLDEIVREADGRLYAAKDGRVPQEMWSAGYPDFEPFTSHIDPAFSSDFWRRVSA